MGAPLVEQHPERDAATNASIKPDSDEAPLSRQADHLHISPTILPSGVQTGRSDAQVKLRYHAECSEQPTAPHRTAQPRARSQAHKETRTHMKDAPIPLGITTQLGATESRSFVSAVSITGMKSKDEVKTSLLLRLNSCFYASVTAVKPNLGGASRVNSN